MGRRLWTSALTCATLWTAVPAAGQAPAGAAPELLLILDLSGSMWGQIDGENKVVIARRALTGLVDELPDDAQVGLIAYGHRREGDCEDIETVVPTGPLDRVAMRAVVDGLDPKGKTPITGSIEAAAATIRERRAPTTLILISDGLETCGGDPCAMVRAAREAGADLLMHVVGFGIEEGDVSQLECAPSHRWETVSVLAGERIAVEHEFHTGDLVVGVVDGETLVDATVRVSRDGESVALGRTYTTASSNPKTFVVAPGTYSVRVQPLAHADSAPRDLEVTVEVGETSEHVVRVGG